MEEAIEEFEPTFIIYNAGTDVLINDPLGGLDISEDVINKTLNFISRFSFQDVLSMLLYCFFCLKGIIRRDEMMFKFARKRKIPIAMLTSGGYQENNALIIAHSIMNLFEKGLITRCPIKLPPAKSCST